MKQKKGPYGKINVNGTVNSDSLLFNCKDEDFLDEIEEGIKPLVKACIEVGIDTFSSCQGHIIPNRVQHRAIDIIIDKCKEHEWLEYINSLCSKYDIIIHHYIFDLKEDHFYLTNKYYIHPIRLLLYFVDIEKYDYITQILTQSILDREFPEEI